MSTSFGRLPVHRHCADCGSMMEIVHVEEHPPGGAGNCGLSTVTNQYGTFTGYFGNPLVYGVCPHCDWIGETGPRDSQPPTCTSGQFWREYQKDGTPK